MAVEITVTLLKQKLENLLKDKDIVYPRLRRRVTMAIKELEELQASLEKAESIKGSNVQPSLPSELLRDVYCADDIIESFWIRSALTRQRLLLKKIRPFSLLVSFWSQFHLTREMERVMSSQFLSRKELEKVVIEVEKLTGNLEAMREQPSENIEAVEEDGSIAEDLREQDDHQLDCEGKGASEKDADGAQNFQIEMKEGGKYSPTHPEVLEDLLRGSSGSASYVEEIENVDAEKLVSSIYAQSIGNQEARNDGPYGQGFQDEKNSLANLKCIQDKPAQENEAEKDGSTDITMLNREKLGINQKVTKLLQSAIDGIPLLEDKKAGEDGLSSPGLQGEEYYQNNLKYMQDQPTEKDGSAEAGLPSIGFRSGGKQVKKKNYSNRERSARAAKESGTAIMGDRAQASKKNHSNRERSTRAAKESGTAVMDDQVQTSRKNHPNRGRSTRDAKESGIAVMNDRVQIKKKNHSNKRSALAAKESGTAVIDDQAQIKKTNHSNRERSARAATESGTAVLDDQVQRSIRLKRLRLIFRLPIYISRLQSLTSFQPRLPKPLPHIPIESDFQDQKHSQENLKNQEHYQANWENFAPSVEEADLVGMADQADDLVHLVLGNHKLLFLISVVGPPGSGKTTLARRICARIDVRQNFQCSAWISVSKELEEKDLLIEVLRQVTVVREEERLPLDSLRQRFRSFLSRKRYLIVFDDIQSLEVWNNIKSSFPNSLNGSRVILCIRVANDSAVIEHLTDQWITVLQVRQLDEEESWALFLKKLRTSRYKSIESELISLKKKIWRKSNGLPLAIVLLGGLLSTKEFDYREWSKVIDKATLNADKSTSKDILTVGYQDLSPPLKACLLYLGLFPRSYEIPIRRLLQLWIAEELAPGETEELEDLVEGYLNELIARSMIEVGKRRIDGSARTCRVPGVLYDTLFPSAAKMGFYHVQNNFEYTPKHVRRIAEYLDISGYPASDPYNIRHLRSYISFNSRKGDSPTDGVDKLLNKIVAKREFGLLTVLDLEHVYKPVLSETLGKLLRLKYLGLRWTFLDLLPASIGKLHCLETLDLKHTNITALPLSIWKATKLRHLYMNDIHFDLSSHLQSSSSIRGSLANLRTLWGLLIGNNISAIEWLQMLTKLRKLGLTCHVSSMEQVMVWISKLKEDLRSLRLRSIDEFNRPSDLDLKNLKEHAKLAELYLLGKLSRGININELPQNLKILTLSVSQLEEDPMPILGELLHLNILRLFARSYLGKEMNCPGTGFPELRVLKLWMLEELKKWTVEEGSMPCLKELEIRCCTKLEPPAGLKHVTTLRELTLTNMPTDFAKQVKANLRKNYVYIRINQWDFPMSRKDSSSIERQQQVVAPHAL